MKKLPLIQFILLLCLSFTGASIHKDPPENKFLNFSDLHFDPFYDTTIVHKLIMSDHSSWENIFYGSEIKSVSNYGRDSNFPLLKSLMVEMKDRIPEPDFIIITGDFMGHDFNENYEKFSGSKNQDSLYVFIEKTIRFLTSYITKFYPNTQIFPMVGNDDSFCGDYMIDPQGEFLNMLSEVWEPVVNKTGSNASFRTDFSKGGYCLVNFPSNISDESKIKMLILNTVFFSSDYKNICGDTLTDPGLEQLEWLENVFRKCKADGNKLMLSYHIPPGIDIYGTIHGKGDCSEKIMPTWKEKYSIEFIRLIKNYSDIILSQFAGHFHRDDFRIFYEGNNPVSFIHITPSVSPVYDNNPAYQIFSYDNTDFSLHNYETYYLNNVRENNTDANETPQWLFEYNFNDNYDENSVNIDAMLNVAMKIADDSTYRESYIKFYTCSNETMTDKDIDTWCYNVCGFGNLTVDSYAECLCATKDINLK
ncbi:MAG: metallophosphoesterase [Ignavibacteria bacterium]|nr:metallophosphoesterase [Ignavibacteria bacterium]